MTENITVEKLRKRNPLIELWDLVRDIVQTNVTDVNVIRAADSNTKARNWIFPNLPEKNDAKFPRGVIKFSTLVDEQYAANDFVEEITDDDDNYVGEFKGTMLTIPVTFALFVKKDQTHKVELNGGTVLGMQNTLLSDHIALIIKKSFKQYRYKFIEKRFDIISNINVTPTYVDNTYLFACNIEFDVSCIDVWDELMTDGNLIAEYELYLTAQREL